MYPIHNFNWRDVITVYIHNKTRLEWNTLAIKQKITIKAILLPILPYTIATMTNNKEDYNSKRNYNHDYCLQPYNRNYNNNVSTIHIASTNHTADLLM